VQLPRSNRSLLRRLQQSALLAVLLLLLSTRLDCLTAITNANIATAATAWVTSPTTAVTTYGNIADWGVSAVSNVYQLFYNEPTLNSNVGSWNIASVSTLQSMFNGATAVNQHIGSWNALMLSSLISFAVVSTASLHPPSHM
jgi:hypothetical protein